VFYSVSECTPNSNVTVEFTSTQSQQLDIAANITVSVNGSVEQTRPLQLGPGYRVSAQITTPAGYLGHRFIPYTLDNTEMCFAVVNKNLYQPTVIPRESRKRWFNYDPAEFRISFYGDLVSQQYTLGFGKNLIDIELLHVVLDNMDNAVCFYSSQQEMVSRVKLPAGPIDYVKRQSQDTAVTTYNYELICLCNDGKLYRISFDNRYVSSDSFEPTVTPIFFLDDLYYLQDLPNGGSFMDMARWNYLRRLYPYISALDLHGTSIWIAGYENISRLTTAFSLQSTVTIAGEDIVDLACIGSDVIAVTRSHEVYYVTAGGSTNLLYTGSALGSPCSLNNASRVAVPDPNNRRILIFDGNNPSYTVWETPDFAPAYCFNYDNQLWVTGHDNNRVLHFTTDNQYEYYDFEAKVTLISVIGASKLATHSLEEFTTLDLTGIERAIPIIVPDRSGPVSHIGMEPIKVKLLGQQGIAVKTGTRITSYSNGAVNGTLNTGDYLGVSFRAQRTGPARSCFVLGDRAYDFTISAQSSSDLGDYYNPAVTAINRITPIYGIIEPPDYGDQDLGITLDLNLGFQLNYYGNIYSNINVGTDGYITFESDQVYQTITTFGELVGRDILYPEPGDLYQGLPINNVDPLNITVGRLDSNEIPRIYFKPQQLGEFNGFRLRWVGTTMSSLPLGVNASTTTSTVNWADIPLLSTANIQIGDYISGNGITVSSQVTNKFQANHTVTSYQTGADYLLLTVPNTSLTKYSNIKLMGNTIGFVNGYTNSVLAGNVVLDFVGNTVIVDQPIHANVTVDYVFVTATGARIFGACSLVTTSNTITVLNTVSAGTSVKVTSVDQDKFFINQTLKGPDIVGTATVVSKTSQPVNYILTSNANIIVENTGSISFTLTASGTTLTNGSNVAYTISGTNVTAGDFGLASLSGNVTISAGSAVLVLTPVDDAVAEELETFTVTMEPESGVFVNVSAGLANVNVAVAVGSGVTSTVLARTEYFVVLSSAQSIPAGNSVQISTTTIEFAAPVTPFTGSFSYELNKIFVQNGPTVPITVPTVLNMTGNFVTVSNPQTLTANTVVLFKANVPAPAVTYEVGFYTGKTFQYIEYFYDSANHDSSKTVGITGADELDLAASTTTSTGTSVVFGSYSYEGQWRLLGPGSFTEVNQGFYPRTVDLVTSTAQTGFEARYEFILTQRIPTLSNVYAALSYGYLERNYRNYTGVSKLATMDHFVVTIPFGSGTNMAAPILSIGDYQLVIPCVAEQRTNTFLSNIWFTDGLAKEILVTSNITIPASGTYYVPEYYKTVNNESGSELEFTRFRSGNSNVIVAGTYTELQAGDIVQIGKQLTSRRTYDTRSVTIIGPWALTNTLRTVGTTRLDSLNFGTLNQPYVRYEEYEQFGANLTAYNPYRTSNLRITANGATITSSLYLDTPGVVMYINGENRGSYATNVSTNSNLSLDWTVQTYFESNVTVYQVIADQHDGSNIFIPFATWAVNNRSAIGGVQDQLSQVPLLVNAEYKQTAARVSADLTQQHISNDGVYITGGVVTPDFAAGDGSYINISTVSPLSSPGDYTYLTSDAIESSYNSQPDTTLLSAIGNETEPGTETYFTSNAIGASYNINKSEVGSNISVNPVPINQTYLVSNIYSGNIALDSKTTEIIETAAIGNLITALTYRVDSQEPDIVVPETEFTGVVFTGGLQSGNDFAESTTGEKQYRHTELVGDTNSEYADQATEIQFVVRANLVADAEALESTQVPTLVTAQEGYEGMLTSEYVTVSTASNHTVVSEFIDSQTKLKLTKVAELVAVSTAPNLVISPTTVGDNSIRQTIGPDYVDVSNWIEYGLAAEHLIDNHIEPSLQPSLYQENNIYLDFDATVYQPIDRFIELVPLKEYQAYRPVSIPFELDQESHWEMTDAAYGAVSTTWLIYADNGRWGDMGLNRGSPPYRGPFLPYLSNTGATVLTTVTYANITITDLDANGNIVSNSNQWVYTNGVVYFYNSGKDTFTRSNSNVVTVNTSTMTMSDGNVNVAIQTWGGSIYGTGGYTNYAAAASMAARYVSAGAFQVAGTDIWNYRIYFNNNVYCTPRRGPTFPVTWLIRGG